MENLLLTGDNFNYLYFLCGERQLVLIIKLLKNAIKLKVQDPFLD